MSTSLLLLAGLALAAEPEKTPLPTRMLSLPSDPAHVRIDGNRLFVSSFHGHKLAAFNIVGKKRTEQLPLDFYESYRMEDNGQESRTVMQASGDDLVLARGKVFIGQCWAESILIVDQETFQPVKRLNIGGEGRMAVSADGTTVFFASNRKSKFHIIDAKTYEHKTVAYPDGGRGIGCLAVSPDGRRLYLGIQRNGKMADGKQLGGGNCFLAAYDLQERKYLGTVFLAQQLPDGSGDDGIPWSFAFAPDGKKLYVGMFQSRAGVQVVDTRKLELVGSIPFANKHPKPAFEWSDPMSVAVYGRWLLVAVRHNQEVAVVDLATHKVLAKITHTEAVDIDKVMVQAKQIFIFGGSSAISIVEGDDLAKLLAKQAKNAEPILVALTKK